MSRSEYSDSFWDEGNGWLYRQAVENAIRGKRGQAFLRELIAALDALPVKRLIEGEFECNGDVCALGAIGLARGTMPRSYDITTTEVAKIFGIPRCLAAEIMYENDTDFVTIGQVENKGSIMTRRFDYMRRWAEERLVEWDKP